jgi:Fe-S oxidoreductase
METLDRKMENIQKADISLLVTGNPACKFQLKYGAQKSGLKLEVVHLWNCLSKPRKQRVNNTKTVAPIVPLDAIPPLGQSLL